MRLLRITLIVFAAMAASAQAASWSTQPLPLPAGTGFVSMGGTSCLSSTWCVAVGTYGRGNGGHVAPFAERWNGTRWTVLAMPAPSSGGELHAVSCFATGSCVAVGFAYHHCPNSYETCNGPSFSETYSHGRWTLQQIPPQTDDEELTHVSCYSATACIAVGTDYDARAPASTLAIALRWNGHGWTRIQPPAPAQPTGAQAGQELFGVSCPSSSTCTAVGDEERDYSNYSVDIPLVERWNGSTWTPTYLSLLIPPRLHYSDDQGMKLNAVSCASAASCTAVGLAFLGNCHGQCSASSAPSVGVTEGLTAKGWANTGGANQPHGELAAVSCWSTSGCLAIGSAPELWNGMTWAVGAKRPGVQEDVSCLRGTRPNCVVVGDTRLNSAAFAERYS